jgi:hypothetical protein
MKRALVPMYTKCLLLYLVVSMYMYFKSYISMYEHDLL